MTSHNDLPYKFSDDGLEAEIDFDGRKLFMVAAQIDDAVRLFGAARAQIKVPQGELDRNATYPLQDVHIFVATGRDGGWLPPVDVGCALYVLSPCFGWQAVCLTASAAQAMADDLLGNRPTFAPVQHSPAIQSASRAHH